MRKLDFPAPAKGVPGSAMSPQDKKQLANDRQRRERLKRQLRLLYDDVAREDVPDALMALVDQIGQAPSPKPEATPPTSQEEPAPE